MYCNIRYSIDRLSLSLARYLPSCHDTASCNREAQTAVMRKRGALQGCRLRFFENCFDWFSRTMHVSTPPAPTWSKLMISQAVSSERDAHTCAQVDYIHMLPRSRCPASPTAPKLCVRPAGLAHQRSVAEKKHTTTYCRLQMYVKIQ